MTSVLYVHTRFDTPGGANTIAVETANRLSDRPDFEVAIATARFNDEYYSLNANVRLHEVGGGSPGSLAHWAKLPWVLRRIAVVIDEIDVDVVVFHSIPTPYWTLYLERVAPEVRFLWYAHDPNAYLNLPGKLRDVPFPLRSLMGVGLPAIRWVDRGVITTTLDGVIVNSEFTRGIIKDVYELDAPVVYPGIDLDRFEQSDGERPSNRILFTVGQLNRYNNFDVLIRSMAELAEQLDFPPHLIIAGTGPQRDSLEALARSEGLADLVEFTGYVTNDELIDYYRRSIATVYLPEDEPFGLVPIEAMATGTPVIALDSGGIRETVVDGQTGMLVANPLESSIAAALAKLVTSPDLCRKMGHKARERSVSRFSIDNTVSGLEAILGKYA